MADTYITNLFLDERGMQALSEHGPFSTIAEAREEAIEYVNRYKWTYVGTLSNLGRKIDFNDAIEHSQHTPRESDHAQQRSIYFSMQF